MGLKKRKDAQILRICIANEISVWEQDTFAKLDFAFGLEVRKLLISKLPFRYQDALSSEKVPIILIGITRDYPSKCE